MTREEREIVKGVVEIVHLIRKPENLLYNPESGEWVPRTSLGYLYYHVFAENPMSHSTICLEELGEHHLFSDMEESHRAIRAWEIIKNPQRFTYMGVYMKLNNTGDYFFKGYDMIVKKAWNVMRNARKFNL